MKQLMTLVSLISLFLAGCGKVEVDTVQPPPKTNAEAVRTYKEYLETVRNMGDGIMDTARAEEVLKYWSTDRASGLRERINSGEDCSFTFALLRSMATVTIDEIRTTESEGGHILLEMDCTSTVTGKAHERSATLVLEEGTWKIASEKF